MTRLFGAISLCRKAGKLVMGTDAVKEKVGKGDAALVLTTSDLSARSAKGIREACEKSGVRLLPLPCTMGEVARFVGKDYGIFAVCDRGFANMIGGILEKLQEVSPEN